jgi:hypothetical protein
MYRRIFISYATEDFLYAEKLYKYLESKEFRPWMDKIDLLPGQNWDYVIQQELRKADFIILLLSDISSKKRGYVQKEFNQALIYCEEKLESDIFIIPILINPCNIPDKLLKFQWVNYSSDDTFDKIFLSINTQREILINEKNQKEASLTGLGYKEEIKNGEYGKKTPKQTFEIKYPVFNNSNNESLHEINLLIESETLDYIKKARNNYFENLKYIDENDFFMNVDSTMFGQISIEFISTNFLSYTSFWSLYNTGAAHGNYGTHGNCLFINPVRDFNFKSLFSDFDEVLPIIRDLVHNKLMIKAKNEFEILEASDFYLFEEGLTTDESNFENYYIKNSSIFFVYNTYQLTCFALGDHHPEVTFNELLMKFPNEKKLFEFVNLLKLD